MIAHLWVADKLLIRHIIEVIFFSYSSFFASPSIIDSLPRWASLILIGYRMLAVCYFAAAVHEKAANTAEIMNTVPVTSNLAEIKHFQNFLTSSRVALTGRGFFALKKGLILTVER